MNDDEVAVAGISSPVGRVSVAVTTVGVAQVRWAEPEELASRFNRRMVADKARTEPVLSQLREYFDGSRTELTVPLDWSGTSGHQRAVLQALHASVRFGSSVTYGDLAARSGTGVPARGIGAIMGSNPLPIVVPCHRVLAHDGLGGYSGGAAGTGLEVKRWLLALEGVLPATLI
ncbi:methylated-DNA--[protein]-cysteine S-methyltransferase [Phytoactinopolyspora alkaliphila]|uniref:Methylated-DNA--protein-cysteine methyltransferase n=1 Tax=Phytoactinopolyspora alkaliphila TaxID=1783498 RepID=A0A6N9YMH0_9ACTN|nr:methylated-DNA--[protein]-cysteine S-methyltransferase [Phytoactinopolyspora alkaliphila]NED96120.1 methylated-DNA--[protein]-cysteine S-methyltransferase [Phytoactinopolyspora alkaliphila]